ncbi:MAG: hypothetical protein PHE24_06395 [Patescibacteria group bacterium]|nr:hypothetical protein [Patescibacteria group bacterium]
MDTNEKEIESGGGGSEAERQREERERQVKTSLDAAVSKHRQRKKMTVNETVESVVKGQPEAIKEKVMRTHDRIAGYTSELEKYGVPKEFRDSMVKTEVDIDSRETQASYRDKRIDMPNQELAKLETMRALSEVLDHEPTLEDLKKVARVTFDLNGLKVVNDYSGDYAKGDLYLRLMKKALENDEVKDFAEDNRFKFTACREGGDEFSAIITSEIPLTEEVLNGFIKKVKNLLENDSDAENCLNMDDDETILRWKHKVPAVEGRRLELAKLRAGGREIKDDYKFTKEEQDEADRLGEKWKTEALVEYRKEIPPGFKFKGRVAAAAATVYDGLMDERNAGRNVIGENDNYEDALVKMTDCEFASGDKDMHVEKVTGKAGMYGKKDTDPYEYFLVQLYDSTRSGEQAEELDRERKKSEALNALNVLRKAKGELQDSLVAAYEAEGEIDKNSIAEKKLAIRVKEEEIKSAEEKVKQFKETT